MTDPTLEDRVLCLYRGARRRERRATVYEFPELLRVVDGSPGE